MPKEKVLNLANKIAKTKRGSKHEVKVTDPEYKILEPFISEEMAEIALCLELKQFSTAQEVAKKCGKPLERVDELLHEMAWIGAILMDKVDGIDKFALEIYVPGVMEAMANNLELIEKHPIIGECFEEYTRKRGAMLAGNVPVGLGLMRVIPVETAIDGESRRASFEEVSKYILENEDISVSNCSCRNSRRAMGEGCGHLAEDMCIQLGHAARYYIRTGRGRRITKEEAFEILRKGERDGLIHQIPNTDGPGKTHAICNCCGCSCFSLRTGTMYNNYDTIRSNYVSKVDEEKCVACGQCVENCQVNAVRLGQSLCTKEPLPPKPEREIPYNTEWTEDKYNLNHRETIMVEETGTSPCKTECPAHISVQGYIKMAAQGRYREALELIKNENPFPAVCGRICPRKCESDCTRGDIDEPVAIDEIKKYIAEQELNADNRFIPEILGDFDKKIAIIGAGPAGLSCAYFLAVKGYKVTVFEKERVLGGMLTLGIPSFRLEKDIINAEIQILRELGVTFKTGIEVGKDIKLEELRTQGYEAFYVAIGAQGGRKLGLEGEDAEGVLTGVDFLRAVNLDNETRLDGKTIVIGGGNVAIDVARTATRVGASEVEMFCLETKEEIPALDEEIDEALEEEIKINNSWGPERIIVENGRVVGVQFKKCIAVFDNNGKFDPKYDNTQTKVVKANHVLIAVGQVMEWGNLIENSKIELNPNKTVIANKLTFQTKELDVFAGGDAVTGPKFAIDAIAQGKQGATSIHRFVHKGQRLELNRERLYHSFNKEDIKFEGYDNTSRQRLLHVNGIQSKQTFKDLRQTFTWEQVKKETERCLGCGVAKVDDYVCVGCGVCTTKCKFDAISLVKVNEATSVEYEKIRPTIIKNMIKRKGRIFVKNFIRGIHPKTKKN